MTWLVPFEHLALEQIRAVEADIRHHRLVVGAPGSGKTQILLHRAAYLMQRYSVPPERLRIFAYTNVLRGYIGSALDMLDLPEDSVSTFDGWCSDYYRRCIGRSLPRSKYGPDFDAIRLAVRDHVLAHVHSRIFDVVLVDEGQDLDGACYEVLRRIAGHLTVCADHQQQIYDQGADEATLRGHLGLKRANDSLLEAFRCSPYILDLAAALVEDSGRADELRRQVMTNPLGRETPVIAACADFEDEKERLIDIVRTRTMAGEKVAILLPQSRQVFGFAKGLQEAGLEVEVPRKRKSGGTDIVELDFNSDRPKVMTYHAAKGLTFDSVCLPRLVPASFSGVSAERAKKLLFVGITRATKWVYLSGISGSLITPVVALIGLEETGSVSVQRTDAGLFASSTALPLPKSKSPPTDDFDDLL